MLHSSYMSGTFNTYLIMSKAILTLACSILISGPSFGADRPVPDNVVNRQSAPQEVSGSGPCIGVASDAPAKDLPESSRKSYGWVSLVLIVISNEF